MHVGTKNKFPPNGCKWSLPWSMRKNKRRTWPIKIIRYDKSSFLIRLLLIRSILSFYPSCRGRTQFATPWAKHNLSLKLSNFFRSCSSRQSWSLVIDHSQLTWITFGSWLFVSVSPSRSETGLRQKTLNLTTIKWCPAIPRQRCT